MVVVKCILNILMQIILQILGISPVKNHKVYIAPYSLELLPGCALSTVAACSDLPLQHTASSYL